MKCPHCGTGIRLDVQGRSVSRADRKSDLGIEITYGLCPECTGFVAVMKLGTYRWVDGESELVQVTQEYTVFPQHAEHCMNPCVPDQYRQAFNEAHAVLSVSPKASAALSRRLLQQILREEHHIKPSDLNKEIEAFLKLPGIPKEISGSVDAVRSIGNFAAHPLKYTNTGEIADVEDDEARWLLETLEYLIDYTFIQPEIKREREASLNRKLGDLGKPPIRS